MTLGRMELRLVDREKDLWKLTLEDGTEAEATGLANVVKAVQGHYDAEIAELMKKIDALKKQKAAVRDEESTVKNMVKMARSAAFKSTGANFVELAPVPGRPYRTYNMGNDENLDPEMGWTGGDNPVTDE